MVVLGVPCRIKQCHALVPGQAARILKGGIVLQLGPIAFLEFLPALRPVAEPFAQLCRGRNILVPEINPGVEAGDAPGPDAIHQNPHAVVVTHRLIDALDPDHHEAFSTMRESMGCSTARSASVYSSSTAK